MPNTAADPAADEEPLLSPARHHAPPAAPPAAHAIEMPVRSGSASGALQVVRHGGALRQTMIRYCDRDWGGGGWERQHLALVRYDGQHHLLYGHLPVVLSSVVVPLRLPEVHCPHPAYRSPSTPRTPHARGLRPAYRSPFRG